MGVKTKVWSHEMRIMGDWVSARRLLHNSRVKIQESRSFSLDVCTHAPHFDSLIEDVFLGRPLQLHQRAKAGYGRPGPI